jgi:two-component system phosphate regulon sensor histidine kinase PhoR
MQPDLQEKAKFEAMISALVDGVVALDEQGQVMFCNPAASDLLGLHQPAASGSRLGELGSWAPVSGLLDQVRMERKTVQKEFALARPGKEQVLDVHAAPFEGGGAKGYVLVLRDHTEFRRLERIRRDFVANVSHELKTPLTSIKGYVETLLEGAIDDEANRLRFLQKIDLHVKRLTALVQDLLSLARIEAQGKILSLVPVDWGPILEEALRRHEPEIRRKRLSCRVEGGGELVVKGESEGMTQILDNLLDNAIKYTSEGGAVAVSLEKRDRWGRLRVCDTGVGIPAGDMDRIFERFYRVDKARSRELGGTGLGLSIVKHLVQGMEGTVRVQSEVGKGSCFEVDLPLF